MLETNINHTPCFVTLPARGAVIVSGAEAADFLQKLTSNDLNLLKTAPLIHSALLTPHGKYLHDFFISQSGDEYILECEGGARAQNLLKRLVMYRLRSRVDLDITEHKNVYAVFNSTQGLPDPRHKNMGNRSYDKPDNMTELEFKHYDILRIQLALADGTRDAEVEKSTLQELNMEESAASYTKGCYLGQEITSRMYNRNLGKKSLRPFRFKTAPPAWGSDIVINDKLIGEMRSACAGFGLVLARHDALPLADNAELEEINA